MSVAGSRLVSSQRDLLTTPAVTPTLLFTVGQHLALRTRDKSCTATGCTIPAAWCHAHHRVPWSKGGATDLANGRLLCPRHHTMIHQDRYTSTDQPDGRVQITRRRQ
jgi:hypothetical protein